MTLNQQPKEVSKRNTPLISHAVTVQEQEPKKITCKPQVRCDNPTSVRPHGCWIKGILLHLFGLYYANKQNNLIFTQSSTSNSSSMFTSALITHLHRCIFHNNGFKPLMICMCFIYIKFYRYGMQVQVCISVVHKYILKFKKNIQNLFLQILKCKVNVSFML